MREIQNTTVNIIDEYLNSFNVFLKEFFISMCLFVGRPKIAQP